MVALSCGLSGNALSVVVALEVVQCLRVRVGLGSDLPQSGLGPGLGPGMGRNGPATSALEVAAQAAQLAREMGVNESTSADSAKFS